MMSGGEGGIRTHGTDGGTRPVFDSRLFFAKRIILRSYRAAGP